MTIKKFDLCKDPFLNEWANNVLLLCVEPILATCKTHRIRSVILTGSFSRGEASLFLGENGPGLAGDIEFLLVSEKSGRLSRERSFYESFKSDLSSNVSQSVDTDIDVDIGLVGSDYFYRKLRPSIFVFDLVTYGKTLHGKDYLIDQKVKVEDIPQDDALALLMNRAIELLILSDDAISEDYLYHLVKILLDMAGSLLAFTGRYCAPYRGRAAALKKLVQSAGVEIPGVSMSGLIELVEHAVKVKLDPSLNAEDEKKLTANDAAIKSCLAQLISWQMRNITGSADDLSIECMFEHYFSREPFKVVAREWIKYCIHPFRSDNSLNICLLPLALLRGSPKSLIYSAAMKCFFGSVLSKDYDVTAPEDLRFFNKGHDAGRWCEEACLLWTQVVKHN